MLQRAASNAYSWWWASHIRTKQSKWLEQSLQDMDEIVQSMLKLIEEDGDSFAKRAEMYYKRRPELIGSVEEVYKQFRALADRYDLLSKELQNANHTIATVFPEQVQLAMSEEEDGPIPKFPQIPNEPRVPQAPKAPTKELKNIIPKASKKYGENKSSKAQNPKVKSGLTKEEALEEVDKLQKDILALQTVKEFVKSSYESGLAKYMGMESQIMEIQQKVSSLKDEFDIESVIEDDEARTLMAEAALKSCQEMMDVLEDKQEKSTREAREESKRIEAACERLQALRRKYLKELNDDENLGGGGDGSRINSSKDMDELIEEAKGIEDLPEKNEESFDLSSLSCLTVSQFAEKIDQLVSKVIGLETAVSSQIVLVNTLRSETDDLNAQIRSLEEEKEILTDDMEKLSTRVKELEEKLNKVQGLNKSVESQNSSLQTNFTRARTNLDQLSDKLGSIKVDDDVEGCMSLDHLPAEKLSSEMVKCEARENLWEKISEVKGDEDHTGLDRCLEKLSNGKADEKVERANFSLPGKEEIKDTNEEDVKESDIQEVQKVIRKTGTFLEQKLNKKISDDRLDSCGEAQGSGELNWQQMLLNGLKEGEKILLKEYTTILRNRKDVKKKLAEVEKKEREAQFDMTLQMRELKTAIQKRDEEILFLRQRLANKDVNGDANTTSSIAKEETESELIFIPSTSRVEEKLRTDIDAMLDDNLDFWFRFTTAFHHVQKFKAQVDDLHDELTKIKEKQKPVSETKSQVLPIYKHLRETQRAIKVWLEQSVPLKDELNSRFSSLCSIQEDITKALRQGVEEEVIKFSSHQAAKLQGEIMNMKQENNKVREELEAGLDHVSMIRIRIDKTLRMLDEDLSGRSENTSRNRVPLRSFIFGTKEKKHKNSIFPWRYQILRDGIRLSNHTAS